MQESGEKMAKSKVDSSLHQSRGCGHHCMPSQSHIRAMWPQRRAVLAVLGLISVALARIPRRLVRQPFKWQVFPPCFNLLSNPKYSLEKPLSFVEFSVKLRLSLKMTNLQ